MWEHESKPEMTDEHVRALHEKGRLKPLGERKESERISLIFTPNSNFFLTTAE